MLQSQLSALYQETWPKLNALLPKDRGISNPLFIHVPPAYETAALKLVIIGRETHGWLAHLGDPQCQTDPAALIEKYRVFDLGRNYVSSPFWWAAHALQGKLAPQVPPFGFVWSNLFICDQNQTTPQDDIADLLRGVSILKQELAILKPDVVVFFCGVEPLRLYRAQAFFRCRHHADGWRGWTTIGPARASQPALSIIPNVPS